MTFGSPFWLLALLPVGAAAVLAFVHPVRRNVIVGSLALWQKAARGVGDDGTRATRRIPPGWALLLTGAVLAVLALARPIWRYELDGNKKEANSQRPVDTPTITFEGLAGETRPDGKAELFARLRNHTDQPFTGSITITSAERAKSERVAALTIPPRGIRQDILIVPGSPTLRVQVKNDAGDVTATADVRKIQPGLTRVAALGDVSPILHRYIQADDRLALVSTPAEADVVLAQGVNPPKGVAALCLAPPVPPPGWREGKSQSAVTLERSETAGDDPVTRDVNVAAMAVRRMQPWRSGDKVAGKALLLMDNQAVIVRSAPEDHPTNPGPRRVYVAFAITTENTNIETVPGPFVTLLANAIRWLHSAANMRGRYICETLPRDTFNRSWHLQEREESKSLPVLVGAPMEKQMAPTSEKTRLKVPREQTRLKVPREQTRLKVPREQTRLKAPHEETHQEASLELRPWLIVAAMLCWLAGWWRSGRKAA